MFDWIRARVLRALRVPHDPTPPFGAPGSIRIFRAGRNFYYLRLFRWGVGQLVGVVGLCFSLMFFSWFKSQVEFFQHAGSPPAPTLAPPLKAPAPDDRAPAARRVAPAGAKRLSQVDFLKQTAARSPSWLIGVLEFVEAGAVLFFIAQIPVSFAVVRLEFELHWYIVTDRSLRIRSGVMRLQESTMSFANLQQVEVKQGPLQRLLGLADVHVQSAGGGGDARPHQARERDSLHTGIFESVENATEIRDLILERLRLFRHAGLGDHDDPQDGVLPLRHLPGTATPTGDALAATRDLLAEARALRAALR